MWHHKFDPHTNPLVGDIPAAELSAQPAKLISHKASPINDFLQKSFSNNQSITQRALRESS